MLTVLVNESNVVAVSMRDVVTASVTVVAESVGTEVGVEGRLVRSGVVSEVVVPAELVKLAS